MGIMLKFYKMLGNIFDMGWWAQIIGDKLGLYKWARNNRFRKWQDSLTGWKFWTWQIVGGVVCIAILEYLVNFIGLTMIPW